MSIDENVISFGEAKLKRTHGKYCTHDNLTYDPANRIVECRDCERQIDGFDAFMVLVHHHSAAFSKMNAEYRKARELTKARIYTEAARELGRAWSGKNIMAVACPHCERGLLPEDFLSGGTRFSREWEIANRRRDKEKKDRKEKL